jgi:hypothetical protein
MKCTQHQTGDFTKGYANSAVFIQFGGFDRHSHSLSDFYYAPREIMASIKQRRG